MESICDFQFRTLSICNQGSFILETWVRFCPLRHVTMDELEVDALVPISIMLDMDALTTD